MLYSKFNDILPQIAIMDTDMITIETSRSDMELMRGFGQFEYPNEISPGVYAIQSSRMLSGAPAAKNQHRDSISQSMGQP